MVEPREHWILKAEQLKKEGRFEEAIKILDKVNEIKNEERDVDFWYKKAQNYCEIGEFEQAKDTLYKDLEINSKKYETYFLLGKVLCSLKKYEESLECYNKASEIHDSKHLRTAQKVDQMKKVHKFEEAIKYSDLLYQEKPLDPDYWDHRGRVLFHLKKFNESSKCFKKCLEINPDDPKILYELAKSELFEGNKKKSLDMLEKIYKIDPRITEKLSIDEDFEQVFQEKQFRIIMGLDEF